MLLNQVRCQLAPLEQRLRSRLQATPEVRLIKTIPGFGVILSHTVHAEVGRIDRFAGQKRLASYCLLAPQANETGEHDPRRASLGRRLGHRGNRTLKWAFIEAAHGAVRSGGRWRAMWDRYTDGGRKDRNRGYIKVARELVKVVYSVWKHQRAYSATPPPRGGQPARRRAKRQARRRLRRKLDAISRSGTGQLSRPMVAAR
jgi:transposase